MPEEEAYGEMAEPMRAPQSPGSQAGTDRTHGMSLQGTRTDWDGSNRRQVQPDSHIRSEEATLSALSKAKALQKEALNQMKDNEGNMAMAHERTRAGQGHVAHKLKGKINNTQDLIKGIEDRIESVEDTIRQTGECLFQLQRAYRSKWAPLNVCERRLELRDTRPLPELIRDHFQVALEHERQTLIEARQELADQVQATKEMLMALEAMKKQLMDDLGHKRHSGRIDRACLNPNDPKKPTGKKTERFFLPALTEVSHYQLPSSPKGEQPGTGEEHEGNRQTATRALIGKAVKLEESAMRLCNENDAAMLHTKRESTHASQQTQTTMTRRIEEIKELKEKLENQLSETIDTKMEGERSLMKIKKKLDSHEQPLQALNKQFALRDQRTSKEGIRDPVHDEMESQLDTLKSAVKMLTGKWQATQDMMEKLDASKRELIEDIRCKNLAGKIDDLCFKVTPKKAMELDKMDPRSGRVNHSKKQSPSGRFQALVDDDCL